MDEDIELAILGIIEQERPTTSEGFLKKKVIDKILSGVHKYEIDLRPYIFKELDKQGIEYKEETVKERNISISRGYYKNKNGKII